MTDAEYQAQKDRVKALIERWVKPIGLGWWRIDFNWSRERKEPADDSPSATRCVMECHALWKYRKATITCYVPAVEEIEDDEYLEWIFIHELMHIFVNEIREPEDWMSHEERVCSELASAFQWLRQSLVKDFDGDTVTATVATPSLVVHENGVAEAVPV